MSLALMIAGYVISTIFAVSFGFMLCAIFSGLRIKQWEAEYERLEQEHIALKLRYVKSIGLDVVKANESIN